MASVELYQKVQSLPSHFQDHSLKRNHASIWTLERYLFTMPIFRWWMHAHCKRVWEMGIPSCLAALDGKQVAIGCPHRSGSAFCNYNKFLALLLWRYDSKYTLIMVDIGGYRRNNDAAIFSESKLGQAFSKGKVLIPNPSKRGQLTLHYVIVGDDIFPLKQWLLIPYPWSPLTVQQSLTTYLPSSPIWPHSLHSSLSQSALTGSNCVKSRLFRLSRLLHGSWQFNSSWQFTFSFAWSAKSLGDAVEVLLFYVYCSMLLNECKLYRILWIPGVS